MGRRLAAQVKYVGHCDSDRLAPYSQAQRRGCHTWHFRMLTSMTHAALNGLHTLELAVININSYSLAFSSISPILRFCRRVLNMLSQSASADFRENCSASLVEAEVRWHHHWTVLYSALIHASMMRHIRYCTTPLAECHETVLAATISLCAPLCISVDRPRMLIAGLTVREFWPGSPTRRCLSDLKERC